MPFNQEAIARIAHLARLQFDSPEDSHSIQEDLNRIANMIDQIAAVNTQGIEPMAHSQELPQRLRQDSVTESSDPAVRDQLQTLADVTQAGYYLVPIVIE